MVIVNYDRMAMGRPTVQVRVILRQIMMCVRDGCILFLRPEHHPPQ